MYSFEPKDLPVPQVHQYLLSGVAPRPIAFVSTISKDGVNNLAPFSFFNAFGANPPFVAFSPARSGRTGETKDTYNNLMETGECVIHSVNYNIIDQINLASCEYEASTDEFVKAGFTPLDSDIVKPKRVKESPFHMECKLSQMVELGGKNASGNLAICEVVKFHISEDIMQDGKVLPDMIDLVARNGQDYYTRASGEAVFELGKPGLIKGIGFDGLPAVMLESNILTAGNLAKMAMVNAITAYEEASAYIGTINKSEYTQSGFSNRLRIKDYRTMASMLLNKNKSDKDFIARLEQTLQIALADNNTEFAWKLAVWGYDLK